MRAALLLAMLLGAGSAAAATPDAVNQLYLEAVRLMTEGRTVAATAALEHLIEIEPQHAGAWLELALNHCTLGHPLEAERLFREIELRFAPSAGILDVINSQRRRGCQPWQPKSARSVTLARGTDSNVNQGASNPVFVTGSGAERIENLLSDSYLPRRDSYLQAGFEASRELEPRGTVGFAQLRTRHHDRYSDQDTNAVLVGVDRPWGAGRWNARTMASLSLVSLGGQLYQRQLQLQARSALPLALPEQVELTVSAALGRTTYLTRHSFDASTGELSALLNYRADANAAQGALGLLVDRGEAARLGGNRHGWYASGQLQRQLSARVSGEAGATWQDWRGQTIYSPGLIEAVRSQSTRQWRAALGVAVSAQHSVQLEWRHVQNRENISLFQYNSQVVQLNWRWTGF
ncbi:MAG: tetratricopeptide repeat protein [Pseudomonadota bacterium]|nr:tetratricopeptide repeat protein [Pseudomonadota bacterium]